jgi:hypothetical protein
MHVEGMSVNNPVRKHHPSNEPGSGYDLFYKLGPNQFRLWDQGHGPAPLYKLDLDQKNAIVTETDEEETSAITAVSAASQAEFAFERDLRNYLVKNLSLIEPGLRLYETRVSEVLNSPQAADLLTYWPWTKMAASSSSN